jgi:hypothetical protein
LPIVIAVVIGLAVVAAVVALGRRRAANPVSGGTLAGAAGRPRPVVAEFHVAEGSARVHFQVPLPAAGADEVLTELLGREAVEVVREKRHTLPIGDVHRVIALGRRGDAWVEVATIGLDTPGQLPPPMVPELIPHATRHDFDPFERLGDLPASAAGPASGARREELERLAVRLPAPAQAAVRAQGIDPAGSDAPTIVLGLMRSAGYQVVAAAPGTFHADRAGQRTFVRAVPHRPGEYPELDESEIRKFVVDFGASGAPRGLLLSDKWAPFEIHERERRDPRVRFVTRERIQSFADVLALG